MIVLDRTQAVHRAADLARWAPSVHNTQPWRITIHGAEITLGMEPDRQLPLADPDGRELRISCGAALFTLRLALRHLGYPPEVSILPDPDNPGVLARLWVPDRYIPEPTDWAAGLFAEIERRRTHHRGSFTTQRLDDEVVSVLVRAASAERAILTPISGDAARDIIAALTLAAEYGQRADPKRRAELMRWTRPPGSDRRDGVHPGEYPRDDEVPEIPGRDYAAGRGWGEEPRPSHHDTGDIFLLGTRQEDPEAWIAAGQALQRVLLEASTRGIAAAIHTQALEEPGLRDFLTGRLGYRHPQMIMRLGVPEPAPTSGRRLPPDATTLEFPD